MCDRKKRLSSGWLGMSEVRYQSYLWLRKGSTKARECRANTFWRKVGFQAGRDISNRTSVWALWLEAAPYKGRRDSVDERDVRVIVRSLKVPRRMCILPYLDSTLWWYRSSTLPCTTEREEVRSSNGLYKSVKRLASGSLSPATFKQQDTRHSRGKKWRIHRRWEKEDLYYSKTSTFVHALNGAIYTSWIHHGASNALS